MSSQRTLRSATRQNVQIIENETGVPPVSTSPGPQSPSLPDPFTFSSHPSGFSCAHTVPGQPPVRLIAKEAKLPHISVSELKVLRAKQAKLQSNVDLVLEATFSGRRPQPEVSQALSKTLIFAHPEAGTAVCVSQDGWILTCAHCFEAEYDNEDREGWKRNRFKWLIYYTGVAVLVECQHVDLTRDLALARVVAVELDTADLVASSSGAPVSPVESDQLPLPSNEPRIRFAHMSILGTEPRDGTRIFCIGQPGRDDLESKTKKKTPYHLVEVSRGRYRGLRSGIDPHACFDIGSLMHDAWTYWGHSGAPLVRLQDGKMIGIHSSWDDQTMMRHGVPWMAILYFLKETGVSLE